ncbi:hypothetical protein C8R44DRAFT_890684 [Mycena epipterygia]|nr:hypothetical protein C8R44DRAFT_890684 [Mycena epipterygia]
MPGIPLERRLRASRDDPVLPRFRDPAPQWSPSLADLSSNYIAYGTDSVLFTRSRDPPSILDVLKRAMYELVRSRGYSQPEGKVESPGERGKSRKQSLAKILLGVSYHAFTPSIALTAHPAAAAASTLLATPVAHSSPVSLALHPPLLNTLISLCVLLSLSSVRSVDASPSRPQSHTKPDSVHTHARAPPPP